MKKLQAIDSIKRTFNTSILKAQSFLGVDFYVNNSRKVLYTFNCIQICFQNTGRKRKTCLSDGKVKVSQQKKESFFMTLNARLMLSLASNTHLEFLEGFDNAVVVMHFLIILHHTLYISYKIIFSAHISNAMFLFKILL